MARSISLTNNSIRSRLKEVSFDRIEKFSGVTGMRPGKRGGERKNY